MGIAGQYAVEDPPHSIPGTMKAAVYRGVNDVRVETVPVPDIGPGEMLVRVHSCGVCGTDLKKIATGSHSAPRIFGHETSGVVADVGQNVRSVRPGDRVIVFHHVPCGECFYCEHKTFAQCATYKKVGCTAGFEPSGGNRGLAVAGGRDRTGHRTGADRHHTKRISSPGGGQLNNFRFVSREA